MIKIPIIKQLCLVLIMCSILNAEYETSFDCKNLKKDSLEELICNDEELALKDISLSNIYKTVLDLSKNKADLKKEQLFWLKNVRNICDTKSCLENVYQQREVYLGNEIIENTSENHAVFIGEKPLFKETKITEFVDMLKNDEETKKAKIEILNCDTVYSTQAGKINTGYGGICTIKKENEIREVNICFNMASAYDFQVIETRNDYLLAKFLLTRCFGG
jgi:uncharacterized protein